MLLIYSPKVTNRLRYIFEHVFENMLGVDMGIISDKEAFINYKGPKLNYSSRQFDSELFFYASPLLFERGIKEQRIKVEDYEDVKIFFISKNNSDLPFDPFAASFYLISRYEEYFNVVRDKHDRFPAEKSLAFKNEFLQLPLVDIWIKMLEKVLVKKCPTLVVRKSKYRFVPTYDIDIAYSYKNKGLLRGLGGFFLDIRKGDWAKLKDRIKVVFGKAKDPYDTFEYQYKLQEEYKLNPIYFFLVGEYGTFDKNTPFDNLQLQDLIQSTGDFCDVGIHPSYESNEKPIKLANESRLLTQILKKEIYKSRQHYIRLKIPHTYEALIELDILEDYSMGYPSQIGFRASTASWFYFYDLNLEIRTQLKVFPFAVMDVTLKDYLELKPKEASLAIKKLIKEVKAVNGTFISLWHNSSLSEIDGWEDWLPVYETLVKQATEQSRA